MFEIVYDDGRTTDGRRLDGYPISSPCEPNGSGELKMVLAAPLLTLATKGSARKIQEGR